MKDPPSVSSSFLTGHSRLADHSKLVLAKAQVGMGLRARIWELAWRAGIWVRGGGGAGDMDHRQRVQWSVGSDGEEGYRSQTPFKS